MVLLRFFYWTLTEGVDPGFEDDLSGWLLAVGAWRALLGSSNYAVW